MNIHIQYSILILIVVNQLMNSVKNMTTFSLSNWMRNGKWEELGHLGKISKYNIYNYDIPIIPYPLSLYPSIHPSLKGGWKDGNENRTPPLGRKFSLSPQKWAKDSFSLGWKRDGIVRTSTTRYLT